MKRWPVNRYEWAWCIITVLGFVTLLATVLGMGYLWLLVRSRGLP